MRWPWSVALGLALVSACPGWAQTSGDVAVRLFSTRAIQAVKLTPLGAGASVQTCAHCPMKPITGPVMVGRGGLPAPVIAAGEVRAEPEGGGVASAAGRWRIESVRGELQVVVTVPRERYVMAVLASEASSDDPPAALEALAIVVRSYSMVEGRRHKAEMADFCDSTHCQAARFGAVSSRVREAVEATAGETLWVGGPRGQTRAAAYFSENSGGMTEDAAAVWGGARRPWLAARADPYSLSAASQWHAEISADELREALVREGWRLPQGIDAVRVATRTTSGRVATLDVRSGGAAQRITAGSFRFAVDRLLGWNRLRSDWYTVSSAGGRFAFDGKGYGHGVGMSQAGARALAEQHKAEDATAVARGILRFYFPGMEVRVAAADAGWVRHEGAGWSLISVTPDAAMVRAGDAAWVKARSLFASAATLRPVVRVFPETDLFRQATSEPGWALGATRGSLVSVQPVSVVEKHEPLETLLLHEFLHVLVESEATDAAPLWLREGLVEWLAAGSGVGMGKALDRRRVEADLAGAKTWAEADAAHHAASLLVAQCVRRYGPSAVRGWLRSGVPGGVLAR